CFDGIAPAHEHDRDLRRGLLGRGGRSLTARDDDQVHAVAHQITSRRGKLCDVALSEADAEHEVLILPIAKPLETIAEADDARGRSPGVRQCADFDQAPGLRVRDAGEGRGKDEPNGQPGRSPTDGDAHRAPGRAAGSLRSVSISVRAGGLPQSRGPTASATAWPSRPMTNVVGRPTTPYSVLIVPAESSTSGNVRSSSRA